MDEETVQSATDLQTWERLLHEQSLLFRKTATCNAELNARIEELERELSVWKAALKTADEDKKHLERKIVQLERSIGSWKDDNPLVLCLIDGDGNIFSPDLLRLGQAGGRQAAALLTKGLNDHIADTPDAGRGQIWLTIYCNKAGLLETLTQNDVCDAEQFEAFVMGFNQASPLFSVVDVGTGKEAADAKIRECLRVFTRFPQTSKVFFGGAHDNGYTSTLNYLQNEGLLDKITLLRGYKELAYEIKGLELPYIQIDSLFMAKKLYTSPARKHGNALSLPETPAPCNDAEKLRSKTSTPASRGSAPTPDNRGSALTPDNSSSAPTPVHRTSAHIAADRNSTTLPTKLLPEGLSSLPPGLPLYKVRPPPCNFHYLAECRKGQNCQFSHGYLLSPAQLDELRENAKKWPCPYANRSHICPYGNSCVMGHVCPKGARCVYARQGKCKFLAKDGHGISPENAQEHRVSPQRASAGPGSYLSPIGSPNRMSMSSVSEDGEIPQLGFYLPKYNNNVQRGGGSSGGGFSFGDAGKFLPDNSY